MLDTLGDLADSMNTALAQLGFPTHPADSYRYFVGDGTDCLARRVLPEANRNDENIRKCLDIMGAEYSKNFARKTVAYDGIPQLISALKKQNIIMAILSNKPDNFTQIIIRKLLTYDDFAIVRGVGSSVPKKPDPKAAIQIANELEIRPNEILYLGDTNTDMQTANSAGMFAVGVLWGFRDAKELLENGAKTLVENPMDIMEIIENKT